jgi:hypothetical protein
MITFGIGNFYFRKFKDGGHGDDLQEELAYEYNINLKNRATILRASMRSQKEKTPLRGGAYFSITNQRLCTAVGMRSINMKQFVQRTETKQACQNEHTGNN